MALTRIACLLALAFGACAAALAQPADPPASHPFAASRPIAGRYIVVFKAHVANPATEAANLVRGLGGQLHHSYSSAIKGFAATLPDAAVQALRNNPNVDYVEQDQTVSLNEGPSPQTQENTSWGLDRIDQTTVSGGSDLVSPYDYHYKYTANEVNAFIIDTGIRATHNEFKKSTEPSVSRVLTGRNFVNGANDTNTDDCNGHGTHVAGTVGGLTWGVAEGVSLIPVRVLNCQGSGTWSGVIAGIDWVANKKVEESKTKLFPAVANMSLGGGASSAVDQAVAGAVSKGITMVVAAGNSNADACNYSPARAKSAITVGASTIGDTRASYSNYGTCLDLFAPGSGITSAWNTSDSATYTISGTSMASPHVAGVAALALAANTAASPWAVANFLTTYATSLSDSSFLSGAANRLVYSLAAGEPLNPLGQTVAIWSMSGTPDNYKNGWRASAIVTIGDPSSGATPWLTVADATVVGSFSPGGTASCMTTSTGSCELRSGTLNRNTTQTKLTITSVSGDGMNYDVSGNTVIEIVIPKQP